MPRARLLRQIKRTIAPLVTAVTVLVNATTIHADPASSGPCLETVAPDQVSTVSRCQNGACTGSLMTVVAQSQCSGQDNSECQNHPTSLMTIVSARPVDLGWNKFIDCVKVQSVACAYCCGAAGGACYGLPNPWTCILAPAVCGAACFGLSYTVDPCCWTNCVLDMTTLFDLPGGISCY